MYQGAGRPHPGSKVTRAPSNITTTEWHGSLRVHGLLFSPGDLYLYKRKYAFSIKRYLHGLDDEYEWGVNSQQCGCGVRSSLLPPYSWAPIPSMAICILMLKLMPRYLVNRTFRGSSSKTGVRPIWLFWLLLRLFLKAYQTYATVCCDTTSYATIPCRRWSLLCFAAERCLLMSWCT